MGNLRDDFGKKEKPMGGKFSFHQLRLYSPEGILVSSSIPSLFDQFTRTDWTDYKEQNANFTALNRGRYPVNTAAGAIIVTLPYAGRVYLFDNGASNPTTGFAATGHNLILTSPSPVLGIANQSLGTDLHINLAFAWIIIELINTNYAIIGASP